ncbi:MAG: type I 3-dehydroquinate dehydratase, partial [Planctomycetes bacterium]|nr:type I 3-dehydroquinate dehydratase [Planctomycetota bacterium]
MTFLASSIFVDSLIALDEALDRADLAVKAGAKLIEWRIDAIAVEDGAAKAVEELLRHCPVSSIVTCRPKWEGGLYDGDESDRMELLERIAQCFGGLVFYLLKTLVPVGLSPIYSIPPDVDPFATRYVVSALIVIALTAGLFVARKRFPAGLTAWAIFVVILSPVLGLVQTGNQFA